MPFVGKDEQLCALGEVVAHELLSRSSGPLRSTSEHDSVSVRANTQKKKKK